MCSSDLPRLASPRLASPRLASPRLSSPLSFPLADRFPPKFKPVHRRGGCRDAEPRPLAHPARSLDDAGCVHVGAAALAVGVDVAHAVVALVIEILVHRAEPHRVDVRDVLADAQIDAPAHLVDADSHLLRRHRLVHVLVDEEADGANVIACVARELLRGEPPLPRLRMRRPAS